LTEKRIKMELFIETSQLERSGIKGARKQG
jgi:hypothetical protein